MLVAEVNALQGMAAIGQRPLLMEVRDPKVVWVRIAASKMLVFLIAMNLFMWFHHINRLLVWILSGGQHNPPARSGAQPRSSEFEREAERAALLEEPGGDATDGLPC